MFDLPVSPVSLVCLSRLSVSLSHLSVSLPVSPVCLSLCLTCLSVSLSFSSVSLSHLLPDVLSQLSQDLVEDDELTNQSLGVIT